MVPVAEACGFPVRTPSSGLKTNGLNSFDFCPNQYLWSHRSPCNTPLEYSTVTPRTLILPPASILRMRLLQDPDNTGLLGLLPITLNSPG